MQKLRLMILILVCFQVLNIVGCTTLKKETPREKRIRELKEELDLSLSQKFDVLGLFNEIDRDLKEVGLTRETAKIELNKLITLDKTNPANLVFQLLNSPLNKLATKLPKYFDQINSFYLSLSPEQRRTFLNLLDAYFEDEQSKKAA